MLLRGTFHRAALAAWLGAALAANPCASAPPAADGRRPAPAPPQGLAQRLLEQGIRQIVFAVRQPGRDGHWYANFGYFAEDQRHPVYGNGGKLLRLDLATRGVTPLLEDPAGAVRDPAVSYDARKILFSYRKGGTPFYHLYEIDADGRNLRGLTDGPYDDVEPCYLPDDRIVFVSSRARRWVNCWITQVATLHRSDADGRNISAISANIEHDNTPWPLPDGRILYQRWEYVDRSQVDYHHLWTSNPDGTAPMVFFGNQQPGTVMIDARPIPGTGKVVAIFSPGHGQQEHSGRIVVLDVRRGPDDPRAVRAVTRENDYRDPWAFAEDLFLAARHRQILLLDGAGQVEEIYHLDGRDERAGLECQEPRPLVPRPREPVLPDRIQPRQATGTLVLMDAYRGRNMAGIRPGEIRKLLVLESLPKPINFTGGMDPLTYGGSFTLERVLGTVPVEPDGSAAFEVPAKRPVFFVALDENDLALKRMQSFVGVQPGEVTACAGCHERRSETPAVPRAVAALQRKPSRIEPIADCPDVFDFPRDIQPILDQHCVCCHDYVTHAGAANGPRGGGAVLAGDRGPTYSHSFWTLLARRQVADGRNGWGNRLPRSIGSSASPLLKKIDGSHYGVTLSEHQRRTVWLWIESGAPYAGTYAALGSGMVGVPILAGPQAEQSLVETGLPDGSALLGRARQVIQRRCETCHTAAHLPLAATMRRPTGPSANFERILGENDPLARFSPHALFNLTRPELSLVLLGPLAKAAGGYGSCAAGQARAAPAKDVFAGTDDPDYQTLLAVIRDRRAALERIGRFDVAAFRPNQHYVRQMKQYGILPAAFDRAKDPIDVYQTDRAYWRSLWYAGGKD